MGFLCRADRGPGGDGAALPGPGSRQVPPLEVQADEVVPSVDLPWIEPDGPLVLFLSLSGPSQPKEAVAPEKRVVSRATEGILPVMKVSLFPF